MDVISRQDVFPNATARRRVLQAMILGALAPTLFRCTPILGLQGSFLQLWRSHLDLDREEWQRRFFVTRRLGCREIFLQWVGLEGGNTSWMASDVVLKMIFDEADRQGMSVHLGLPYDERWWKILALQEDESLLRFLDLTRTRSVAFIQSSPWAKHPAFKGWYIPYELEQYNWATPQRQALLIPWLNAISQAAIARSAQLPTISTYHSRLPTDGSLVQLWGTVLNQVAVHPMIQDGVGVAGLANYKALAPLREMMTRRGSPFDIIVELFEELPSIKNDGTDFKARSADFSRVEKQLDIARGSGVQRLVSFAIDPWVIGDMPGAHALLSAWQEVRV